MHTKGDAHHVGQFLAQSYTAELTVRDAGKFTGSPIDTLQGQPNSKSVKGSRIVYLNL